MTWFAPPLAQILEDCSRVVELDPNWAPGYSCRGSASGALGRRQQMRDDYVRAMELAPDNSTLYWFTTSHYLGIGERDLALETINRAIELAPEQGENYLVRAEAYAQSGETALAAADFARYVELTETERIVQNVEPGEPAMLPMAGGRVYSIPFQAQAGQRVTIAASRTNAPFSSVVLVLLAEDGAPLIGYDGYGDDSPNVILSRYAIPADGVYTVLVASVIPFPDNEISVTVTLKD